MKENKIFVVSHKEIDFVLPSGYNILAVGSYPPGNDVYYDNTGINISSKNPNFCELTALYWLWKNYDSDFVGLVHYRRFFSSKIVISNKLNFLNFNKVVQILKRYDIILPRTVKLISNGKRVSIAEHYKENHNFKDLEAVKNIVLIKYPDYEKSFNEVMNQDYMFMFNMFIAKKNIIDAYCSWLFDILFELEKRIDISNYDNYQKRVYGFLAERLFNVWIYKHQEVKACYYPFVNTNEPIFKQNILNSLKCYRKK